MSNATDLAEPTSYEMDIWVNVQRDLHNHGKVSK